MQNDDSMSHKVAPNPPPQHNAVNKGYNITSIPSSKSSFTAAAYLENVVVKN